MIFDISNVVFQGSNDLFKCDPQNFSLQFQQVESMEECCKLPSLEVWDQSAIEMQEVSVQFNTFSKIKAN